MQIQDIRRPRVLNLVRGYKYKCLSSAERQSLRQSDSQRHVAAIPTPGIVCIMRSSLPNSAIRIGLALAATAVISVSG